MRNSLGQFVRTTKPWTPDRWGDGYIDNKGRFRVFRPDYPRAYKYGWNLRAHIVWWLETGAPHPEKTELHHKDHDRLNDVFQNLECLTNSEHQLIHKYNDVLCVCDNCGTLFGRHKWRLKNRPKLLYCTRACFLSAPERTKRRP